MHALLVRNLPLHWLNLADGDERSDKERCDCVSTEPSSFNATVFDAREKGLLCTSIVHVRTVDRPVHARSVGETALQQPCRNCLRMLMLRDGGLVSKCDGEYSIASRDSLILENVRPSPILCPYEEMCRVIALIGCRAHIFRQCGAMCKCTGERQLR